MSAVWLNPGAAAGVLLSQVEFPDSIAVQDLPEAGVIFPVSISESAAAADDLTAVALFPVAVAEEAAAADSIPATGIYNLSVLESAAAVDLHPSLPAAALVTAGRRIDTLALTLRSRIP